MQVLKFGGTSVASPKRLKQVLDIVTRDDHQKIIVLSAMSGATNDLVLIANLIKEGHLSETESKIEKLYNHYKRVVGAMSLSRHGSMEAMKYLEEVFAKIRSLSKVPYTITNERIILAQGELLSTKLFYELARSSGMDVQLISALDFMCTDDQDEPDFKKIESLLQTTLDRTPTAQFYITQGYICKNVNAEIDNLKRGGSDYSATIIGSVMQTDEIQIWTDIDGVRNNDPRIVDDTKPIRNLSYREAAELAYFGAKILHPTCVLPAENAGIAIRLKYTMKPDAPGTLISTITSDRPITALAAKDNITAIKIYSHRMLMAYGFLRKVFQVFEDHRTSVDMITTSEVAVSLTIDDSTQLGCIVEGLESLGEVLVESNHSIVCIVGNALYDDKEYLKLIFEAIGDIPIRMVSMGGSKYNISLLVQSIYKVDVLKRLNKLFHTNEVLSIESQKKSK